MKDYSKMTYDELMKEHKIAMVNLQYYSRMNSYEASRCCDAAEKEIIAIGEYLNPMIIERYLASK